MSSKKYRLAAPTDDGKIIVSNGSTLAIMSIRSPRSLISNDGEPRSKSSVLNNTKINSSVRWWMVLPCLLLIMLSGASDPLVLNDLIVRRYERYYGLSASTDVQRTACRQSPTTSAPINPILYWQFPLPDKNSFVEHPDYNLVQRDAASFNVKNSIATLIPAVFTFILLGSNSDMIGRRPLIILPFFGKVIRYTLMLIIVSRDLSNNWLIGTHALEAIFGSGGLVILSSFAYITDCTNERRTRAFFVAEVIIVIGRIIPILGISLWLRYYLYTVPLSVDLILSIIGLFYAIFIQPESVETVKDVNFLRQLTRVRLKPIIRVITVFTIKRRDRKRHLILLITIVSILVLLMLYGFTSIFPLYLYGHPFCLNAFNVGLLSLSQGLTIILISLLIILCQKSLDKTYVLPIIGSLSLIVGLILFSIAKRVWLLYIGACIGSLFFVVLPILRTKLTKLVEVDEYAIVFIGAGTIETIGHEAVGAVANTIYKSSLQFFPGLVFLIFGIIGLCPLIIMCYLTFSERTEKTKSKLIRKLRI